MERRARDCHAHTRLSMTGTPCRPPLTSRASLPKCSARAGACASAISLEASERKLYFALRGSCPAAFLVTARSGFGGIAISVVLQCSSGRERRKVLRNRSSTVTNNPTASAAQPHVPHNKNAAGLTAHPSGQQMGKGSWHPPNPHGTHIMPCAATITQP